jgi:hypothetical protein
LRFRLREALRPFELERLLSLGARAEESLSTRLDSDRAPDLLWVPREPLFDDEERRPRDFDEDFFEPAERLLLLDRDWAICPVTSSWIVRDR